MTTVEKQKGFTIVETLMALAVLLIAVAGPVYAIGQSFGSSEVVRDRTVAKYLAQEGIELVRWYRDNIALAKQNGLTPANWIPTVCTTADGCFMSTVDAPAQCPTGTCPIMKQSQATNRYQYLTGNDTRFTRTIKITEIDADMSARVEVDVTWKSSPLGPTRTASVTSWVYNWTREVNF